MNHLRMLRLIPKRLQSILKYNSSVLNISIKSAKSVNFSKFSHKPLYAFAALPSHIKINMPALSPTMKKGTIVKWLKQEGDKLVAGDILCEVETDKATVGFDVQEEGFLARILMPEGSKDVSVGELVALVVDNQKSIESFKNYISNDSGAPAPVQEAPKQDSQKSQIARKADSKTYPKHDKVSMPALSPTMKKGKIVSWSKKEGDKLSPGDILCEVETDKATVGFEIQDEGYLAKILVSGGQNEISVGELVAVVVNNQTDCSAFSSYTLTSESESAPEQTQETSAQTTQKTPSQTIQSSFDQRLFISPLAKKTAAEKNVPLDQLRGLGSGPNGRVIKNDVDSLVLKGVAQPEKKAEKVETKPKPAAAKAPTQTVAINYIDIPLTNMRKVIAERLLESKTTIPHYYLSISVNMNETLLIREKLNKESKVKISINDFIVKASALACKDVPEANSQWMGDKIRQFKNCDCSIAVSTDSGLITPIVFSANLKGLSEIAATTKELADKARKNQLKPNEFQGGTFTISNLGMFGIDQFIAVVNPPQSCILAIGKTEKVLVPHDVVTATDSPYKVVNSMNVTLSLDHRVVDGAVGARWLNAFKDYMEKPYKMLL